MAIYYLVCWTRSAASLLIHRRRPRDRVDCDLVTDPIPSWDHHTLARGLSVPLSRLFVKIEISPLEIFVLLLFSTLGNKMVPLLSVSLVVSLVGDEGHQPSVSC